MLFKLSVLLCGVISVHIEAATIKPVYIIAHDQEIAIPRVRDQSDVYGAENVQLNGRTPRAPSWPEKSSDKGKMFLAPRLLEARDQINITGQISRNPQWVSLSLITQKEGPNGAEPDYNNIACQIYIHFDSNDGDSSVILKTIKDGALEEYPTGFQAIDLIPDLHTVTISEVTITLNIVLNDYGSNGVEFYVGPSYIDKCNLKHKFDDIRYIVFDGAVEKVKRLDFVFA